jgi:hypothetical protein
MSRDLVGWNRKSANLPQTDLMRAHYAMNRPPMGEWFVQRFLQELNADPVRYCWTSDDCKAEHRAGALCGAHKPAEYALSWSSETKVPRVALRADFERFCRVHRLSGSEAKWQDKKVYNEFGLAVPTGKNVPKMDVYVEVKTGTVTKVTEMRPANKKLNVPAKPEKTETVDDFCRKKVKIDQACYKIPPLKDIRAEMVKKGWILPSDPSPFEEEASASESEEASASENEE